MTKETIDALLLESSLDEETREYVAALVLDGEEEDLADTLGSFLCEDGDATILSRLLAQVGPLSTQVNEPEPLRRLTETVVLTTGSLPPIPQPATNIVEIVPSSAPLKKHESTAAAPAARHFGTSDYGSAQHAALDELDELEYEPTSNQNTTRLVETCSPMPLTHSLSPRPVYCAAITRPSGRSSRLVVGKASGPAHRSESCTPGEGGVWVDEACQSFTRQTIPMSI